MTNAPDHSSGRSSAQASGPLCEARGVTHEFMRPDGKPLIVLRDISLEIRPREVLALLGPSGCGKSTLLRILAGLLKPTTGEVRFGGAVFPGINPGMALVFQSFALYPWMTVADNIRTVLVAAGIAPAEVAARVAHAVQRVGLGGFEGTYPRELSGGMKQRVGVARALALDPQILFLDEPFCHLDALTAESLRAEVLDLWTAAEGNPSAILLVSHDIPEVVAMADRILLLGANPGRVLQIVENKLPRPRNLHSPEALAMIDHLHDLITGHEMPDAPKPVSTEAQVPLPLPAVRPIQILGLLELLEARGGSDDLFLIAGHTKQDFGVVIDVVKAAELLGCVSTPKRQVLLTADGRALLSADHARRTELWRELILRVPIIRLVVDLVRAHGSAGIDRDTILETVILALPQADYEKTFATIIGWSRFGALLAYNKAGAWIRLAAPAPASAAKHPAIPVVELASLVDPARVLIVPGSPAKAELLALLAARLATSPVVTDAAAYTQAVLAREQETSTSVGHGFAVPHALLKSVTDFVIALAIVPAGCAGTAAGGEPVRVMAMIAAPAQHRQRHLQVLAAVAAQLNRPEVRTRMLAATDGSQVVAAFLA